LLPHTFSLFHHSRSFLLASLPLAFPTLSTRLGPPFFPVHLCHQGDLCTLWNYAL
jgi:hypothetical protein